MYKRIGATFVCTALALSLTACGTDDNNTRDNVRNDRIRTQSTQNGPDGFINGNAYDNGMMNKNSARNGTTLNGNDRNNTMSNGDQMNNQQQRLVQRVRNVNGVNDATVFVNGRDIIVGLELNNVGQRAKVEQDVRRALEQDNNGYNVHVTSERAMHDRIRSIQGQMQPLDGQPVRDMATDIADLLRDMGNAVTAPFR
ncbi:MULTISPECIES: YhcN/YlaJ family sporulation lipoprotein [Paenibacillus]|uniref:YhcN/YlaJ family sporulation lipoprotein n=1 Tax=Paenibacillus TaxID=44249 RepID=UPI00203E9AA9|nr:YhcN/YlaJ family sporulation lipoprotein [Paenibacillus camelliae]MCM3635647.1 YhcN/YlaJ family sporulation lipoprotein [Paenibacillus camelliae]